MNKAEASHNFTRRGFLAQAAAAATGAAQDRGRPVNLIYVFADQLRRFSCGYAGDEFAHTPNIDRLARESLDVRNATAVDAGLRSLPRLIVDRQIPVQHRHGHQRAAAQPGARMLRPRVDEERVRHGVYRQVAPVGQSVGASRRDQERLRAAGALPAGLRSILGRLQFQSHLSQRAVFPRHAPPRDAQASTSPIRRPAWPSITCGPGGPHPSRSRCFFPGDLPHDPWDWANCPSDFSEQFRNVKIPLRPNYSDTPDPYADAWATPAADYASPRRPVPRRATTR